MSEAMEAEKADILIVDDLPEKLLVFETVLAELGQNLVSVRSGSDALREVLKREFAVILLDVNMPDVDGFETAALIRRYKRSANTPIIFITAYADEMQTAQGYSLGAVDYILSPVLPEVLRSKVKVFVDLWQARQRTRQMAEEQVARAQAEAARRIAEENTRRSSFLAEASAELGQSLQIDEGMRCLLKLVVPGLLPEAVLLVEDVEVGGWLLGRASGSGPLSVPRRIQRVTESELARNDEGVASRLAAALAVGSTSNGAVPLRAGERRIGALLMPESSAAQVDLPLIEDLANRAAMAFENARLYGSLSRESQRLREAEEHLQEAHRRKDEFLAMLSHELRNPLAPIRTAIEIIRRVAPPDPTLALARDAVDRQVTHLVRLVEELLDVSRISEGRISLKKEQLELSRVVAQAVETALPLAEQRNQSLTVRLPPRPVWVFGDFVRLTQVFGNLLNNAVKYTPEGGHVSIVADATGGEALVTVEDDGHGIEPRLLPQVFDLFVQGERSLDRSQGGLGIGLTLVKRLVELHQGRVEAHSDGVGRGARFRVFLPCVAAVAGAVREPREGEAMERTASSGRRVLVVDDNVDAAEVLAAYLRLEGHEAKVLSDGAQLLSATDVFEPQAIVLDIGLPGLNGYELARQLRANPATSRVLLIALTGYGSDEDRARAADAGFDWHFTKPAGPPEIQAAIERGRDQPAGAASPRSTATSS